MRVGENFCPGILHAVQAKDGLLTRIRLPGGLITSRQLEAVAELSDVYADGNVEITSRSNLQLRAIKDSDQHLVVEGLVSAGFLPSTRHDRVRNISASPFTGLGFEEILDCRPLVRELDRRLIADPDLAGLPAKFNFAIEGGGEWFSRDIDDLALHAVTVDNALLFHLSIGGEFSGFGVVADEAIDGVLEAARRCLQISMKFELPARGKRIASQPQAISELLDLLSLFLVPCPLPKLPALVVGMPVGIYSTEGASSASLVPSIPLGRLTAAQARCVASIAQEYEADLRLAPWRGIVLGFIAKTSIGEICARLGSVGLSSDGRDGYRGVAACAGSAGCDASWGDVRGDASRLASRLFGHDANPGWTVNISGCEKRCAMRHGATVELVASPAGYSLKSSGGLAVSNIAAEAAIDAVITLHEEELSEVS